MPDNSLNKIVEPLTLSVVSAAILLLVIISLGIYVYRKRSKWLLYGSKLGLVHIIVILASILLIFIAALIDTDGVMSSKTVSATLKEIGFAGIIAILITYTLELFSRRKNDEEHRRRLKDINESLFLAVYGRDMPKSIMDELSDTVPNHRFFRRDLSLMYDFVTLEQEEKESLAEDYEFKCNNTFSFNLFNATKDNQKYPLNVSLEKPVGYSKEIHKFIRVNSISITSESNNINEQLSDTQKIDEFTDYDCDPAHIVFKFKELNIPPNTKIAVTIFSTLLKKSRDYELWENYIPSTSVSMTVNLPTTHEVFANIQHSKDLVKITDGVGPTHQWKLENAILPHQSIVMWWDKKRE